MLRDIYLVNKVYIKKNAQNQERKGNIKVI